MSWNWTTPPGATVNRRAVARKLVVSLFVGMLSLGVAWAGTGLVPVGDTAGSGKDGRGWLDRAIQEEEGESSASSSTQLAALGTDQVYAGAAKVEIFPDPESYSSDNYEARWETNRAKCESQTDPATVTDLRVRFNEDSNCIYTGGFDIGPANSVDQFDKYDGDTSDDDGYGLWVRSAAISDGNKHVVLTILDGAYYFSKYANMCNDNEDIPTSHPDTNEYGQDCGWLAMQNSMAEKHQIAPESFFLASTHSHTSPDFIGAWGGVPRWYMQQVEDAIRTSVDNAIAALRPAYLERGESLFRRGNTERRKHYRSAEEASLTWFRAIDAGTQTQEICTTPSPTPVDGNNGEGEGNGFGNRGKETPAPAPSPSCTPADPGDAVFTVGTYAAHPTSQGSGHGRAHADTPVVFSERVEERFGGVGLFFQTGLGNMSNSMGTVGLGNTLGELIPENGSGLQVTTPTITTKQVFFDHPVTNSVLAGGGMSGIFDRPMEQRPSAVSIGKESLAPGSSMTDKGDPGQRMPYKRCNSASPVTVNTSISVAEIGPTLLITGGPGELFSNYTNTIKERYAKKSPTGVALPLALVNDAIGYIMQSFETDHMARQGVGFANGPLSEYEDAYSIDACLGDHALEQTIKAADIWR